MHVVPGFTDNCAPSVRAVLSDTLLGVVIPRSTAPNIRYRAVLLGQLALNGAE